MRKRTLMTRMGLMTTDLRESVSSALSACGKIGNDSDFRVGNRLPMDNVKSLWYSGHIVKRDLQMNRSKKAKYFCRPHNSQPILTQMPKKTTRQTHSKSPKKSSAQWTATSRLIRNLEPKEMLDLFRQLYLLSTDNAELIDSQFKSSQGDKLLEEYREKIIQEFFPERNPYDSFPKMGKIKQWIRDYQKGTGDMAGTTELMVTFQEQGANFTMAYGDIDERFYDSLLSGWNDLEKMLTKTAPELFPAFRERMLEIVKPVYGRVGWGYGDGVFAAVADIYAFHGLGLEHSGHWKTEYEFTVIDKNKSQAE